VSVEAEFGQSDWVGQLAGTQVYWEIAWDGVYDDWRFGAVSFQSDFFQSRLTRISETFISAGLTTHFGELIRAEFPPFPGHIVAFRFAVVVIPNR
jgi:hypothetical protein